MIVDDTNPRGFLRCRRWWLKIRKVIIQTNANANATENWISQGSEGFRKGYLPTPRTIPKIRPVSIRIPLLGALVGIGEDVRVGMELDGSSLGMEKYGSAGATCAVVEEVKGSVVGVDWEVGSSEEWGVEDEEGLNERELDRTVCIDINCSLPPSSLAGPRFPCESDMTVRLQSRLGAAARGLVGWKAPPRGSTSSSCEYESAGVFEPLGPFDALLPPS